MGNLRSVSQAVQHAADQVGVEVFVTSDPDVVRRATRVVLPGQGAMPDCMRELRDSGLLEPVLEAAATKPLVDFYRTRPTLRSINGAQSLDRVAADLNAAVEDIANGANVLLQSLLKADDWRFFQI